MESHQQSFAIKKRHRPWLRWLKHVGWGLLALLIVAVCAWSWWHYSMQKRLDEALAELDRSEPGWRLEDIEATREQIAEEENSAGIVVAAGVLLPKEWTSKEIDNILNNLAPEEQLAPDDFVHLTKELDTVRPALEKARKLAGLTKGRHHIKYARNIIGTLLKSQSHVSPLTQLLLGDALRHEQVRKLNDALISCRAALNAGRSLGDEPMAVSQLIRTRSVVWSCRGVERALAQGEPLPDDLASLQELLADEDDFPDLLVCMRGERAAVHAKLDGMESGDVPLIDRKDWEARLSSFLLRDQLREKHPYMLALMNQWLATARLPPKEQAVAEAQLDRDAVGLPKDASQRRSMTPVFARIGDASRLKHACLRCAIVALAAERYRQKHKTWPDSLDQLCPRFLPAVPRDPLDGSPLRYRRLDDGAIVYSVSTDGVDNNGNLDPKHIHEFGVDAGYRLWDVAKRRQPARP